MKIEIRRMQAEDLSEIVAIEQSWDYLSKWGEEGYRTVLNEPRVYACLVAEDAETGVAAETLPPQDEDVGSSGPPQQTGPMSSPSSERGLAPSPRSLVQEGISSEGPQNASVSEPTIAGFAIMALLIDHCELCNLVVRPAYLSKKVGYMLLRECLAVAKHVAATRIFLEVRQSNRRAIEFYKRNGFQIASQRKNYYHNPPEHAWIMERTIAPETA